MRVREARDLAVRWVEEHARHRPGFRGALLHGSIHGLPPETLLPASSDVDLWLLVDEPEQLPVLGKRRYRGGILDLGGCGIERASSAERILGDYRLAPSFAAPASLLAEHDDRLAARKRTVERRFAERRWIERRCDDAVRHCTGYVDALEPGQPGQPDLQQAIICAFAAGGPCHVLLVAGLRNPTVRKRYASLRSLLAEQGMLDVHESLLALQGCAELSRARVEQHLAGLEHAFDRAAAVDRAEAPFEKDIQPLTRPIAIEGSRELCTAGLHREAVFWILVTWARCLARLEDGGGEAAAGAREGFETLLRDLAIGSPAARQARMAAIRAALPRVRALAASLAPAD